MTTRIRTEDGRGGPRGGPGEAEACAGCRRTRADGSRRRRGAMGRLAAVAALSGALALAGCAGQDGTSPGALRFGQVGEVRVRVETPLGQGDRGMLRQVLSWDSDGPWTLTEKISYRGLVGDVDVRESQGNPGTFASAYASLITLVNESPSVGLFIDALPRDLNPECGQSRTRVTVRLEDESRNEVAQWTRCTVGSLETLAPEDAGPDAPEAVRVIQAAILARDFSLGESFRSIFHGSVPFGTLDRGADSRARLDEARIFINSRGRAPGDWNAFWLEHLGPGAEPPEVDWRTEMVVAGSLGTQNEAGDSVQVRRILSVDEGSLVEISLRSPGNFCSPAARTHVPFHIVVAPKTPQPIRVVELPTDFVPCGT